LVKRCTIGNEGDLEALGSVKVEPLVAFDTVPQIVNGHTLVDLSLETGASHQVVVVGIVTEGTVEVVVVL